MQTTLCYLEKDGQYLMLHRVSKKNDVNHDKWIGVGGKFEPGETPETSYYFLFMKRRGHYRPLLFVQRSLVY